MVKELGQKAVSHVVPLLSTECVLSLFAVIDDWLGPWSFFCVHRNRDSQCFSSGRKKPKIVPFRGKFRPPPSNRTYMVPWAHPRQRPKRHLDLFSLLLQGTSVMDTQTDIQTDHATHAVHKMWPNNNDDDKNNLKCISVERKIKSPHMRWWSK